MAKKILIVTECFYPEEFKINDVALAWKEKGYHVDVLTLAPTYPFGKVFDGYKNKFYTKDSYKNINIYRLYAVTGYRDSKFKKILKYINFMVLGSIVSLFIGKKYDYIFGFNMSALTGMLPAVLIKKIYKKPLLFWTQDIWPDSVYAYGFKKTKTLSLLLNTFVKFMYHNVSAIAVSGEGFKEKLKPYSPNNLVFNYLPNWADDLEKGMESVILSVDEKVHFSFAGNVGKVQNLENIIDAFCLLPPTEQKKAQLNIIGDGSNLSALKLRANNPNIVFHGKIEREKMEPYYRASDFLIVSLIDKDVFSVLVPAKIQTYIAAKKPILAIIKGDAAKLVEENKLGLCSSPSNINSISSLFKKCIAMEKTEREGFINKNDQLLETTFNKEKTINKLLGLLVA